MGKCHPMMVYVARLLMLGVQVMVPFVAFLPLGACFFGFGLDTGWSWPIIAVAYAISSFGSAPISSVALTYVTDSYIEVSRWCFESQLTI